MSSETPAGLPGQEEAIRFAMSMLEQAPKGQLEAHLTGVLLVFWSALWGSFGTEYARGFIESQLRGMEGNAEKFTRNVQ